MDRTQGRRHARQVLYHCGIPPGPEMNSHGLGGEDSNVRQVDFEVTYEYRMRQLKMQAFEAGLSWGKRKNPQRGKVLE
jgi:hypothetical protein